MLETLGLLILLAVVVAVDRGQWERRRWHRRTDPACSKYRAPRTALGRWWHDRGRGKGCPICVPAYSPFDLTR